MFFLNPMMASTPRTHMAGIDDRGLKATIAQVLDRWPCAGSAVAVITDGGLTWLHGHGSLMSPLRRRSRRTPSFCIASLTKTFTGVAVMQLWEQGLVDPDAPANDYLRTFRLVPAKPNLSPATVRHSTHTAGVGYWRRPSDLLQPGVGSGDRARPSGATPLADYDAGARFVENWTAGVQQPRACRARADRRGRYWPAVGSLSARPHLRPPGHGAHRPHPDRNGSEPTRPPDTRWRSRGLKQVADREVPTVGSGVAYPRRQTSPATSLPC